MKSGPDRRPKDRTGRDMQLVIGYKAPVEQALQRASIPHWTVAEMRKLRKADNEAVPGSLIPCGDCGDIESVLAALDRAGIRPQDVDLVWGSDEFSLVTASVVGMVLGCRSPFTPNGALRFRDKYLQKRSIAEAGLPTARTAVLARPSDIPAAVAAVGLPAVLKPLGGAGTRLTYRIGSEADLADRLPEFFDGSPYQGRYMRAGSALLEEFVVGDELHVDGCVYEGKIPVIGVSRYIGNNLEVLESGGPCGAYLTDPIRQADDYAAVETLVQTAVKALGLVNGVFHMELFETERGFQFSECAARWGGNGVVENFREKFGLDLFEEHVKALSGLPAGTPGYSSSAYCRTFMGAKPGLVVAAPSLEALLDRPGVLEGTVDVSVGKPTPDMRQDTSTRAASAIVEAPDEATLLERVDDLRRWFYHQVLVKDL